MLARLDRKGRGRGRCGRVVLVGSRWKLGSVDENVDAPPPFIWAWIVSNRKMAATMGRWVIFRTTIRILRSFSEDMKSRRGRMNIKGKRFWDLYERSSHH